MKKTNLGLVFLSMVTLETTPASAVSEAAKARGFSCTQDCTGNIADCDTLSKCEDPKNKCIVKGGLLSQMKGRLSKVEAAIQNAKATLKCDSPKNSSDQKFQRPQFQNSPQPPMQQEATPQRQIQSPMQSDVMPQRKASTPTFMRPSKPDLFTDEGIEATKVQIKKDLMAEERKLAQMKNLPNDNVDKRIVQENIADYRKILADLG